MTDGSHLPAAFPTGLSPAEARALQVRLRQQIRIQPLDVHGLDLVAGADVSFDRGSHVVYAGFVALTVPELRIRARAGNIGTAQFRYVPGLLSFREIPPLLAAWQRLGTRPGAIVCDGHGYAHPRRFGFACHLGYALGVPTVGCAKSVLVGSYDAPGPAPGDWSPLADAGEVIGAALRTRAGASPVFVSIGNQTDLESAIRLVMRCVRGTRLPETTRAAHAYVNALRRDEVQL